jgi:hypothetical protein
VLETAKLAAQNSVKMIDAISRDKPFFFAPGKITPSWTGKRQKDANKKKPSAPKTQQTIVKIKRAKQKAPVPAPKESNSAKEE